MRKLLIVSMLLLGALPAAAQAPCPEGKTASGKCVDPALALDTEKTVRAMTQPKISYTAPPFLPSEDGYYGQIPRDANEIRKIYGLGRYCITTGMIAPVTTCY